MSSIYKRGKIYWYHKSGRKAESLKTTSRKEAEFLKSRKDLEHIENPTPFSNIRSDYALSCFRKSLDTRCTPQYAKETETRIQTMLSSILKPYLSQVVSVDLEKYLSGKKTSPYDINNDISAFKAFFHWAVKNGMAFSDPTINLRKIKIQESSRDSYTEEQVKRIIEASKDEILYPAIMVAIHTGMRKTEIFRLRGEDIDFRTRVINVRISKSKRIRMIPFGSALDKILPKEGPLCDFHNHRRILGRILNKAKVGGGWHTFRHTTATLMLRAGIDLATVSRLLGHSSLAVTAQYLHTSPPHMHDAVKKLATILLQ